MSLTIVLNSMGCGSRPSADGTSQDSYIQTVDDQGSLATFTGNPNTTQLDLYLNDVLINYSQTVIMQASEFLNCQIQHPPRDADLERGFVLTFGSDTIYLTGVALTFADLQQLSQSFDSIHCQVTATFADGTERLYQSPSASLKLLQPFGGDTSDLEL